MRKHFEAPGKGQFFLYHGRCIYILQIFYTLLYICRFVIITSEITKLEDEHPEWGQQSKKDSKSYLGKVYISSEKEQDARGGGQQKSHRGDHTRKNCWVCIGMEDNNTVHLNQILRRQN